MFLDIILLPKYNHYTIAEAITVLFSFWQIEIYIIVKIIVKVDQKTRKILLLPRKATLLLIIFIFSYLSLIHNAKLVFLPKNPVKINTAKSQNIIIVYLFIKFLFFKRKRDEKKR